MEKHELEIYIGPFSEWKQQKLDKNQAIKLVSNGNVDTLRISASISKSIAPIEDTATIQIYNLSEDTRNALRRGLSVNIFAGEEGQEKELVYKGGITRSLSVKNGPDIITNISCLTAQGGILMSKTAKSFSEGVELKDIVTELASSIEGVVVDPTNIEVNGQIGYAGFTFIGQTKDALNNLAKQYGFTWSINDGVFKAKKDGKFTPSNIILSDSNVLRKVSPRTDGPWSLQEGVDILARYMPNVGPWKQIKVISGLNKQMSRTYSCHQIEYSLAPKNNEWDMHIVDMLAFSMR